MLRTVALALTVSLVGCGPAITAGSVREGERRQRRVVTLHRGPAVEVSEADFAATMAWLTEDMRVSAEPETREGRVVLASFEPSGGGAPLLHSRELREGYDTWCASQHLRRDCSDVLRGASSFTENMKNELALALALGSVWHGVEEEAQATVSMGRLATLLSTALVGYAGLLAAPEVFFSKGAAAAVIAGLLLYLQSELLEVAEGYVQFTQEVAYATSFDAVRTASERFGHRIGQKTMRLLVMVGTAVLVPKGGNVAATFQELPAFEEAAVAMVGSPGGAATLSTAVTEAESLAVATDSLTVSVTASVAGVTALASVAGTSGGGAQPNRRPVTAKALPSKSGGPTKSSERKSYSSHKAFKRAMGSAGAGKEWHHIVEQTPGNQKKFGAYELHNTDNEIPLEADIHQEVSRLYSSLNQDITGSQRMTVRQWLSTQSFEEQRRFGLEAIEKIRKGIWGTRY